MTKQAELKQKITEQALALAVTTPWHRLTMSAIAEAVGTDLAVLYHHFPARQDILAEISRQADAAVLAGGPVGLTDSPRDRLFDVLMRRFDALAIYRTGIAAILRDVPCGPASLFGSTSHFVRAMAWMLEAAAIDIGGRFGPLQVAGLGLLYAAVVRVWIADESPDLARTMAELDKRLRQAERIAGWLKRHTPDRATTAE